MKIINYTIALFLFFLIISCRNDNIITRLYNAKYVKTENSIPFFQCDSFVMNPFGFEMSAKMFEYNYPGYFEKSVELMNDIVNPDISDTIISFTRDNNSIQFIQASGITLLYTFEIDDSILLLAGSFRIGYSKNNFNKLFGIKSSVFDVCDIGNSEGTNKFRFIFEKNKLTHISYLRNIE